MTWLLSCVVLLLALRLELRVGRLRLALHGLRQRRLAAAMHFVKSGGSGMTIFAPAWRRDDLPRSRASG